MKPSKTAVPFLLFLLLSTGPTTELPANTLPIEPASFSGKIERCEKPTQEANLVCEIVVPDLKNGLTARLRGPASCENGIPMGGGTRNFVVRYKIADPDLVRFSGTDKVCSEPVIEAPNCDFADQPFFGFECAELSAAGRQACAGCADLRDPICFFETEDGDETFFDLKINNINDCPEGTRIALSYLIAVKALEITDLGDQKYHRVYIVDPTVIQEPNCPFGC